MRLRSLSITMSRAAMATCCVLTCAQAAADASFAPRPVPAVDASLSAYRHYAKAQADMLVGMTRVLANAIRHGDLDAAQLSYAPAHRYLQRLQPVARASRDLNRRMDSRADSYEGKEAASDFSGFHRLEYGLFANKSTQGLAEVADRLEKDARALRDRIAGLGATPAVLVDGVVGNLDEDAARSLAGGEELYSKTDLWDLEANVEGARQVVVALQPQLRGENANILAATAAHFAALDALLEKHKIGCGFKSYDELGRDDRLALKRPLAALAAALSTLRVTLAMD